MLNFRSLFRFFSFEAINIRIVLITAAITRTMTERHYLGEPLYMIAFVTLLPWIPLVMFEGVWKVKNYAAVAFLGIFRHPATRPLRRTPDPSDPDDFFNGTVARPPQSTTSTMLCVRLKWACATLLRRHRSTAWSRSSSPAPTALRHRDGR